MQLRFGDEPLSPRFDLEIDRRRHHHRQGELRAAERQAPLLAAAGRLVRGLRPAGTSTRRRASRAASTSASRPRRCVRLLRSPDHRRADARARRASSCRACRKVALEVGAELPDLARSPTSSTSSPRSACAPAARSSRRTSRSSPPTATRDRGPRRRHLAAGASSSRPRRGRSARAASACDIAAQQEAAEQARARSASRPTRRASTSSPAATHAIQFWTEGLGSLPEDWDLFVPDDLVDTQVRAQAHRRARRASRAASTGSRSSSRFESEGVARHSRRARALPRRGQEVRAPRGRLVRGVRSRQRARPCSTARSSS